jgi:hypothetical protein
MQEQDAYIFVNLTISAQNIEPRLIPFNESRKPSSDIPAKLRLRVLGV